MNIFARKMVYTYFFLYRKVLGVGGRSSWGFPFRREDIYLHRAAGVGLGSGYI